MKPFSDSEPRSDPEVYDPSRANMPTGREIKKSILFVVLANGVGGSTRSLATVLQHLPAGVTRIVAVPSSGKLLSFLRERSAVDVHVPLPTPTHATLQRMSRLVAAARIASAAWFGRRRIVAIHANGPEELNIVAPAALLTGIPVVLWSHARSPSTWMLRLAPIWRRVLSRMRLSAVSETARKVLIDGGLAGPGDVLVVPNPIDAAEVMAPARERRSDRIVIGYLGSDAPYKGFQFLPEVDRQLRDLAIKWALYTNERSEANAPIWRRLRADSSKRFEIMGKVNDVRDAYAHCNIVFCPSVEETFCRVAAEAMLNGIPVVASNLEPIRQLVGEEEAGLMFPAGDVSAGAAKLRLLVEDEDLRTRLGARGIVRAGRFEPGTVVGRLSRLYGLSSACAVD